MVRLSQADLEQALAFVNAADGFEDIDAWSAGILPGLRQLVPCDSAAYNMVDPEHREVAWIIDPADMEGDADKRAFNRLVHQHPLVTHHARSRDGRAVKLSDFLTRRQFHRLELYQDFFRPVDIEHQIVITLPVPSPQVIGLPLQRRERDFSERDRRLLNVVRPHLARSHRRVQARMRVEQAMAAVDDDDGRLAREVVLIDPSGRAQYMTRRAERWLRAYCGPAKGGGRLPEELADWLHDAGTRREPAERALRTPPGPLVLKRLGAELRIELARPARFGQTRTLLLEERSEGPAPAALAALGLTRREAAVLALVAQGRTNAEIALRLDMSPRTAQKHLEHINAKLGVATRTAAAAVAWRAGL